MKRLILWITLAVMAASANAVNVSQFAGEVLLVPYYSVRGGQETLLSVVNTKDETKAVKVRFVEALNSREVLDFNLYLSPFDVWTAKLKQSKDGTYMVTNDNSCTVPPIPKEGVEFRTYAFDGRLPDYPLDGGDTSPDRTREGHIEIIEMGIADESDLGYWDRTGNGVPDSTHVDGVPERCLSLWENWYEGVWKDRNNSTLAPTGGLFGTASLINIQKGTEFDVPITMLADFSETNLHYEPGDLDPNLTHANPPVSVVGTEDNQTVIDTWPTGIEAVSAAMMSSALIQEYTVNPSVEAETSWIMSMPTKHYHVDLGLAALAPFSERFHDGQSCDPIEMQVFDREENAVAKIEDDFSPMPPPQEDDVCYETNVLNFRGMNWLESKVAIPVDTPFNNGWMHMQFSSSANRMVSKRNTYLGLPVIGFKATLRGNRHVGIGAAYATSSEHKYRRVISGVSGE